MSLYVFRLRKGSSMKYVRNCWENGANHPKWVQLRIGGGGVTLHVYVRTYTLSFHVFGIIFAIYCLVLFVCLTLALFKKVVLSEAVYFLRQKSILPS